MIRKSFQATTKAVDEAQGIVEAVVNVGSVVDLQDDVMEPGCWDEVIKAASAGEVGWPSICWGHDWSDIRGKVLSAKEVNGDGHYLHVVGQYAMETQAGRDAFALVKGGYVTQWSVGFEPHPEGQRFEKGVRFISRVKRWPEVSNVLIGASPGTRTVATKGEEPSEISERQQRSATRLKDALELAEEFKASVSGQDQQEGVDKDAPAEVEEKANAQPPTLEGPEAVHNKPLRQALGAITTLIQQEMAEDEVEFDCVVRLSCIAQDLISWAQGEASEYMDYGAMPMAMSAYVRAGVEKMAGQAVEEPPHEEEPEVETTPEAEAEEYPDWLRAAMETYNAVPEEPPQQNVPESGTWEQHVPNAVRFRHGRSPWHSETIKPQQ